MRTATDYAIWMKLKGALTWGPTILTHQRQKTTAPALMTLKGAQTSTLAITTIKQQLKMVLVPLIVTDA